MQFSEKFHKRNRQRLIDQLGTGSTVVVTGNALIQKGADTAYPFRQESNFWYLTGIEEPEAILVIDRGRSYCILPERSTMRDVFEGSYDIDELIAVSGVDEIVTESVGWERLRARLMNVKAVATCLPSKTLRQHYGIYANPARTRLVKRLKEINPSMKIADCRRQLAALRMVKTREEITAISKAVAITVDAFKEVEKIIEPGVYEYQLEAVMTGFFRSKNADHAYSPIIAGGNNACTLHYDKNISRLEKGQYALLDVGAEKEHGLADITRTLPVGEVDDFHQRIYNAVKEAQEYAFSLLKPGVYIRDYESDMEEFMGEKLKELGVIDAPNHESIRKYFPHATSHHLGHDVHDVADYELPLAGNMVITVEPGIYVPDKGIGVRIEDNVVITEEGIRNLSSNLPS